jgi:hypothetical protein
MHDTKKLIELHPLYRRLSGQVIWLLFEERGAPEARINAFLERYEAEKRKNLEIMAAALDAPAKKQYTHLFLESVRTENRCGKCGECSGKAISLNRPGIEKWFPPFGLGCALRPRLLSMEEYNTMGFPPLVEDTCAPPEAKLLCGEWVFTHAWEKAL